MKEKITFWWQARSIREQKTLLAWGLAFVALLMWFAIISPLSKRIDQLEKRIPELETRLNTMRSQPLNEIRAQGITSKNGADLRSTLFRLLADKNISAELRALSSSRVEIRLPGLPMKDALALLESLRQESGARVVVLNAKTEAASSGDARVIVEMEYAP
ncbi:type II secretion system protein GspM [Propionivibrio sp.]|uniref:type II secretion system protein GspM n=1 Tax=Propionivibrio sp. TaxID=2212460 RepID=UPI003BF153EE